MKIAGCAAVAAVLVLAVATFAPVVVADDSEDNVIVSRPGVVFHKVGSDDIRGRGVEKSIDAALEDGYTPCRVCFGHELGSLRNGALPAGGGRGVVLGEASSTIPAPPASDIMQPFGVKVRRALPGGNKRVDAVRNPYADIETRRFFIEYGAFESR